MTFQLSVGKLWTSCHTGTRAVRWQSLQVQLPAHHSLTIETSIAERKPAGRGEPEADKPR
jgi:hypothetical protein